MPKLTRALPKPKLTRALPKYQRHRGSGQAVVTLNGCDHYLGPHGIQPSRAEYDRLIAKWLSPGRRRLAGSICSVIPGRWLAELKHRDTEGAESWRVGLCALCVSVFQMVAPNSYCKRQLFLPVVLPHLKRLPYFRTPRERENRHCPGKNGFDELLPLHP